MSDPVNEPSFRLDVAGLPDPFEVLTFTGKEAISEPFVFDVEVLIKAPALDLARLLYRPAVLHVGPQGNAFHGLLHALVQRDHGPGARRCQVRLGPGLSCLGQRFSRRIFSDLSVPQILDQVLKEHGIVGNGRRFELMGDHPLRDFCTQYRESDLQFVQRLCAQAHIHYHFEHYPDRHCLVFGDGRGHFRLSETTVFEVDREQPAVRQFQPHADRSTALMAEVCTDLPTLRSGQLMPLSGHPVADWNQLWLLTHVEHQGSQDPVASYRNQLRAIHWEAPLASPHHLHPPRMHSLQRAWVVDVDEPRPDPSRAVPVQFDWLYQGEGAAPSHCWLPLAAELGSPNATQLSEGTEVVVSFIDGDPDQPRISGFLQTPLAVGTEDQAAPEPVVPDDPLVQLLRAGEPLLLLCLLPGGGSFIHCTQTFCTCRAATRLGESGAA